MVSNTVNSPGLESSVKFFFASGKKKKKKKAHQAQLEKLVSFPCQ